MSSEYETLEGIVEYIRFANEQNGYTVMDFSCNDELLTVVGNFPGINEGESLKITGCFSNHKEYGEQFTAQDYEYITPADKESILKYLASGMFSGVGPVTAQRIVDKFGEDTIRVIEQEHHKLTDIKGLNKNKADIIHETYIENNAYGQVMFQLQKFGIGNELASKIYKAYDKNSISIIEKDIYKIARDINGVGFKKIDEIAKKTGVAQDSSGRIQAGILYLLSQSIQNGHVYLPKDILSRETDRLLEIEISPENFSENLLKLAIDAKIKIENDSDIYQSHIYRYEAGIAEKLKILIASNDDYGSFSEITDFDKRIKQFQSAEGVTLAENQINAVSLALANNISVITGGPGTGKTTIIKCIIKIFKDEGYEAIIAAPTGRAAKRITEATGYEASTIHRLLELQYVGNESEDKNEYKFLRNADNPLDADIIIIDEASMLDINITYSLLEAMKKGSRLILCGDVDQLPSVGAGKILKDIIQSGKIKTVKLTEIYRQEAQSHIIMNAHKINVGEMPYVNGSNSDFFMIYGDDQNTIAKTVADLCSDRLPDKYGFNVLKDIQVLSPARKGICGVENLNVLLQERLNPQSSLKNERQIRNCIFREGDKIMQIKNNYNIRWEKSYDAQEEGEGLYNGDTGSIISLNNEFRYMDVEYDDNKIVRYDFNQLEEIEHAFAVTVHKSQGSEFPAVVIPVFYGPPMLLTRNLIYTAITRARKLVVLVGNKKCLYDMISNTTETKRYTGLGGRI